MFLFLVDDGPYSKGSKDSGGLDTALVSRRQSIPGNCMCSCLFTWICSSGCFDRETNQIIASCTVLDCPSCHLAPEEDYWEMLGTKPEASCLLIMGTEFSPSPCISSSPLDNHFLSFSSFSKINAAGSF